MTSNRQLTVAIAELRSMQRSRQPSERVVATAREAEEAFKRIEQHVELLQAAPALMANPAKAGEQLQQILAAVEAGRRGTRRKREASVPVESEVPLLLQESAPEIIALDVLGDRVLSIAAAKRPQSGGNTGVTFASRMEHGVEVQGDPMKLRDMLLQLISNAAAAIPRRGTVTLGVEQRGGEAVLFVQDDGLGISEPLRQRLLDPVAATADSAGRTCGYAVVHEAVALHRGRIEIESRAGVGTTVRVILPAARRSSQITKPCRVLVVDDDAMVR